MAKADATLAHDDVTRLLTTQIEKGIAEINTANETLLADDTTTGIREIDKALKDGVEDKEISSLWEQAEKARLAYKETVEKARNLYRTKVLGEDEVTESEIDKDEVKQTRKMVMEAVNLLKTYAGANNKKDIVAWADALAIPQVGRQGSSNVGQKKPRAHVSVNGTVHNSFGEAAKAASTLLSDEENAVTVSSSDLVSAYYAAGEAEKFEFNGLEVKVTPKKSAAEKAA